MESIPEAFGHGFSPTRPPADDALEGAIFIEQAMTEDRGIGQHPGWPCPAVTWISKRVHLPFHQLRVLTERVEAVSDVGAGDESAEEHVVDPLGRDAAGGTDPQIQVGVILRSG